MDPPVPRDYFNRDDSELLREGEMAEQTDNTVMAVDKPEIDDKLLARLETCTNLPSPPVVAMHIIDLSNDPNVNIGKVADVISMDPALTAKIMRISNSPIYALRRKTENLHQAITLLGLNGTLTLALSFSLASSMNNNASQGFDYNAYWRRSLAAATCCRRIGMVINLRKGEELLLAGLLQDIGMLVIDKMDPVFYQNLGVDQSDHRKLAAAEAEKLGADHALIGGWILDRWGMPDYLVESVMYSHDPEVRGGDSKQQAFASCIALSGPLVDSVYTQDVPHDLQKIAGLFETRVGVGRDDFEDMFQFLDVDFREAEELFETDLSDYSFSDALLDQAKEALIMKSVENMQQTQRLQETTEMLESKAESLEERSRRDGLTGVYNRAYLDEYVQQEYATANERNWPMFVMFVDLDRFKQVNDNYGHQSGDQVLQQAARTLIDGTREEDLVARYGGEEFVVVVSGQGAETARIMGDRLVNMFRNTTHNVSGGQVISVTASIGVAVMDENNSFLTVDEMIAAADKALYTAKESGRDRWVIHSSADDDQVVRIGGGMPAA